MERLPDELKTYLCHGTERQSPDYDRPVRRDAELPRRKLKACDYKGMPKALLVNSAFPGSNGKKHYHGDEPSFTTDTTALGRMKALLVDGAGNEGTRITSADGADPSFTVIASAGNKALRASTPAGRVVRMTPRCLARFQSVPDWYVLPCDEVLRLRLQHDNFIKGNGMALSCRIIGNGVPPLLQQRVMESLQ